MRLQRKPPSPSVLMSAVAFLCVLDFEFPCIIIFEEGLQEFKTYLLTEVAAVLEKLSKCSTFLSLSFPPVFPFLGKVE